MNRMIAVILILLLMKITAAQNYAVENTDGTSLKYPWSGGMNSCQFCAMDIDLDGVDDLLVFDRHGDRILPFINKGIPYSADYTYDPTYIQFFPELFEWVLTADYDLDGDYDIFTYARGWAAMKVYKNTSTSELRFESITEPFLTSYQGGSYTNILVTYADYPAVVDIDGDTDLDILTFYGLGSFVEMHTNQSIEKYGHADSLDFRRTELCWGEFAESEESNVIYLDTCFLDKNTHHDRHTGSTFFPVDLDNDNDIDLILGDVDYPNMVELINGGDNQFAKMISYDFSFPQYDKTIELFSMPQASYIDIDNDGIKDMIVSPFDPALHTSENDHSIWLYKNTGSNTQPVFEFHMSDFLQNEMIDVGSSAFPVFHDFNKDGLSDLFIGSYGSYLYSWYDQYMILHSEYLSNIAYLVNNGTINNPSFELISMGLMGIAQHELIGIYPAFIDIDNDGDSDLLIGHSEGTLMLFENTDDHPYFPQFSLTESHFMGIDVGEFSKPQLFDLDKDGDNDLIIGERHGNINYYENTGDHSFEYVTDSLGMIRVTDFNISYDGYSVPHFFRDNNDQTLLIVGSEQGKLFYFKDIDNNLDGAFEEAFDLYNLIDSIPDEYHDGIYSAPAMLPIESGFALINGNFAGGLNMHTKGERPSITIDIYDQDQIGQLRVYPNPATDVIHIDISSYANPEKLRIELFSADGLLLDISQQQSKDIMQIDISQIPKGIYFILIKSDEFSRPVIKKVIKM